MAENFITFDEGAKQLLAAGLPATAHFLLSTKPTSGAGAHKVTDTLSGTGVGEITGTGYGRKSEATPAASGSGEGAREVAWGQQTWATETETNWQEAKSVVLVTSADNTGKAIMAWDLQAGGAARNLGQANIEEHFTPVYKL